MSEYPHDFLRRRHAYFRSNKRFIVGHPAAVRDGFVLVLSAASFGRGE
jgi:hypothetical protein